MDSSTKALLNRAGYGDKEAASELLKLHYKKIYSYLRRCCGNTHIAEDLTQETFSKVWSSLRTFRGRCSFYSWICKIAYHEYVNWIRVKDRYEYQYSAWWEDIQDTNPGPHILAVEKQQAEMLYNLVEQMMEKEKQVIHLHYYQGLSIRETAYVLDIATSTVKYRLRNAIKQLRREIKTL